MDTSTILEAYSCTAKYLSLYSGEHWCSPKAYS